MPRYIDAYALLSRLPDDLPYKASVKRVLMQEPTADVVDVVRCKDCNLRDSERCPMMYWECGVLLGYTEDIHFCSYGERKEK